MTTTTVTGATCALGHRYWVFDDFDRLIALPANLTQEALRKALGQNGVDCSDRKAYLELLGRAQRIKDYPTRPILTKIGWNGEVFAMPDGSVIDADDRHDWIIAYDTCAFDPGGSLKKWQKGIVDRLEGQLLAQFWVLTAFVPPILRLAERRENVAFELVGPPATGKTTLQLVACSAIGGTGFGNSRPFWVEAAELAINPANALEHRSDLPMIIEGSDQQSAHTASRQRQSNAHALRETLAEGRVLDDLGNPQVHRVGVTHTGNTPLATAYGMKDSDRLITLMIAEDRPFGVFDRLPEETPSIPKLVAQLQHTAANHYGHAFRLFVEKLVQDRAADEKDLRRSINRSVAKFIQEIQLDDITGSRYRMAEAFGLVFAAGHLARKYGVLPKGKWQIGPAVAEAFRIGQTRNLWTSTVPERLRLAESDDRVVPYDPKAPRPEGAVAMLKVKKDSRELIIPRKFANQLFPDWDLLRQSQDFRNRLVRDGNHLDTKRKIGGELKRVFVLRLD